MERRRAEELNVPDHMLEQARLEIAEIKAKEADKLRDAMRKAEEWIARGQSLEAGETLPSG